MVSTSWEHTTHLQVSFKFWQFPIVMVVVVVQVFGTDNNLSHSTF
jgi:hypothetical protein